MKIAYARTQFWFNLKSGGSVGHTLGILSALKKNNVELKIFSNEEFFGIKNFDYLIISPKILPFLSEFFYNFYARKEYKKEIQKFKPDFIYHRYTIYTFFISKIAKELNVPFILELNSFGSWTTKYWGKGIKRYFSQFIIKRIENYNLKNAFLIVVVSQPLKYKLIELGIPENRILVNPNGVDTEKFNPKIITSKKCIKLRQDFTGKDSGKILIGFAGTFGPWHGIPQFVEAINKILDDNLIPNAYFLLIGEGILKKEAENQIGQYKNVIFLGDVPYSKIQDYLVVCDILVSPHCRQADGKEFFGSPTKIFEYMAMAKGIVASNLGQIGKVIENGRTGLLVEPNNIQDLVGAIVKLSKDKDLREKLGKMAREEVVLRHTWDENIIKLKDKISNLRMQQ